jgi:hypothetical protein
VGAFTKKSEPRQAAEAYRYMNRNRLLVCAVFASVAAAACVACSGLGSDGALANGDALSTACSSARPWATGVSYEVGDFASYAGHAYRCIEAHTSQPDWPPSAVPALWSPTACVAGPDAGAGHASGDAGDPRPRQDAGVANGARGCAKWLATSSTSATSQWVSVGANGKLKYAATAKGDTILDFSNVGYMGGGVALPTVAAVKTLTPSGADDTAAIQAALDEVASKTADARGIRGAVQLAAGTFQLAGSLSMSTGGVVLRGSGSGANGTLLSVTGDPRDVISVHGGRNWTTSGTAIPITDKYVPSGARTFHVADAAGLSVGSTILVQRPVTEAWIHFMGMDTLVRNGAKQTWITPGSVHRADRVVTAINGDQITVDAPLADSYDAQYISPPGASVIRYTADGRISQVGIESLRVSAPPATSAINTATFLLLTIDGVINSWLSDISADGFINGLQVGGHAKWLTIQDTAFTHTAPVDGSAGYPADFGVAGEEVLLLRCSSQGDHVFSFGTQAGVSGPNVVSHFKARGVSTNMAPHQRWATGLLLDDIDSPTGGIELMNRGTAGSGQGWAIGFGVAWNSVTSHLLIEQPPGSQNWAIGTSGTLDVGTDGALDSKGRVVDPGSLYLAQLCERLGPQAPNHIGF